jgi:DNA-binding MarR family transcriptional regulator
MFLVSICRLGILESAVELRHLRYFVAVAEMENVSRAALKLHLSQPALSRQIRDLEDEIGFSLLQRTAKSARLTDAGRAFLDNARALLQNADDRRHESAPLQGQRLPNSTLATHRCQPQKFCRKHYGHFSRQCLTYMSDYTIGATKPFSTAYAMGDFNSD